MRVKTGTVVQSRSIEVELQDSDGELQWEEWSSFSVPTRYKKLSAFADFMLVRYLLDDHLVSVEFATERLTKFKKVMDE